MLPGKKWTEGHTSIFTQATRGQIVSAELGNAESAFDHMSHKDLMKESKHYSGGKIIVAADRAEAR